MHWWFVSDHLTNREQEPNQLWSQNPALKICSFIGPWDLDHVDVTNCLLWGRSHTAGFFNWPVATRAYQSPLGCLIWNMNPSWAQSCPNNVTQTGKCCRLYLSLPITFMHHNVWLNITKNIQKINMKPINSDKWLMMIASTAQQYILYSQQRSNIPLMTFTRWTIKYKRKTACYRFSNQLDCDKYGLLHYLNTFQEISWIFSSFKKRLVGAALMYLLKVCASISPNGRRFTRT